MKELWFVLDDGAIAGLTLWGTIALWAILSVVTISLTLFRIAWQDGLVTEDEWLSAFVGIPILTAVAMAALHWWQASLLIALALLFFVGLPLGAYWLGLRLNERR